MTDIRWNETSHHDERQGNRILHGGVYKVVIGAWLWLLLVFWGAFGFERESAYMMAVATGLFVAYFGISALLMGMQPDYEQVRARFSRFLQQRFETQSGPISGWGSLVQVAIIPVSLALAGTALCLILAMVRAGTLG
ncbi:hypothetical protein [Fodinicurvata sediminis]|uniref:hypothetical protein n=1 Tax=Fodinicurvata sediminis TaxID=1121832 RepID=UPI0003B55444|nr:hypothetical protein [Fodinicurvata sediminis]